MLKHKVSAFGLTVSLDWGTLPFPSDNSAAAICDNQQFYLSIPGVARYLVLPEKNCITIETVTPDVNIDVLNTWLLGTVMAYILQYHGYTVLHGSAVLINDNAVVFSGQSGAGKSTLASTLVQKGHPFITDDLVVMKRNQQGQYCILPGPAKLKLWKDGMQHFDYDINSAAPVCLKNDKYAVQVLEPCDMPLVPIAAFYEININHNAESFHCETFNKMQALKILMQNVYRYFMLKPLGKLQTFLHDCSGLSQQITTHKLTRTPYFHDLPKIIQHIEHDQGILS